MSHHDDWIDCLADAFPPPWWVRLWRRLLSKLRAWWRKLKAISPLGGELPAVRPPGGEPKP